MNLPVINSTDVIEIGSISDIPTGSDGYILVYWNSCPHCHRIIPSYNASGKLINNHTSQSIYAIEGVDNPRDFVSVREEFPTGIDQQKWEDLPVKSPDGRLRINGFPTVLRVDSGNYSRVDLRKILSRVDPEMIAGSLPAAFIVDAANEESVAKYARKLVLDHRR